MSGIRGVGNGAAAPELPDMPTLGNKEAPSKGSAFEDALANALHSTSAQANAAEDKARALAEGGTDDLHGTMIAMKEAEISVKLVGSIRNKLIDAFHELWRTSV
jgi:flagellar hook-basal body complex protein FliE